MDGHRPNKKQREMAAAAIARAQLNNRQSVFASATNQLDFRRDFHLAPDQSPAAGPGRL
jgi:hypothetical protein